MINWILPIGQALEAFGTWIIRDPNAWWIFIAELIIIGLVANWISNKKF